MTQQTKKVPCEVYSRIVGYLRPVQNWNKGKQQEFEDRRTYRLEPIAERECTSKAG
jgi:anaerobic ribonucleoside-triphosphate reductase